MRIQTADDPLALDDDLLISGDNLEAMKALPDYRAAHRAKLALDDLFRPECFLNELIWIYDYGRPPKRRWPAKHDTILVYVRDRARYHFDDDEVDREPYMAPGLVGPEKAAWGKRPSDCWWHTIVPTNSREKTAIRRRRRSAPYDGWSPHRRGPAAGASIRSPAREPSMSSAARLAGDSCSSTSTCSHLRERRALGSVPRLDLDVAGDQPVA